MSAVSAATAPTATVSASVSAAGPVAPPPAEPGRPAAPPTTRERAEELLRLLAGSDAVLREDQWLAIEALAVARRRALVVQRTGWGKSAVYFVATALLREQGAGPTLIVSPLLALMRNQVEAAARAGIRARTINSANPEEWAGIEGDIRADAVDVLLISPERLNSPGFREEIMPGLARTVGLVVVDEAHCISDWGHDFRPDYRRLGDLLARLPAGVAVLATTATANARVTADVAEQLGHSADGAPPLVLRGPLDRESLHLGVVALPSAAHRLAWLGDALGSAAVLPGSGIVYTLTVAQAEDVAAFLRGRGHNVRAYTGRTEAADRAQAEQDLLANEVKALIATSALGMGFDKPDLGFVVHLGAPQSPIAYYQQVGRAGRALDMAAAVLLPGPEDEDIWRWFASVAMPPPEVVERVLAALAEAGGTVSTAALEVRVELGRSRLDTLLTVLDVEGAVRRVKGGWVATGASWVYDAERYARVAAARAREQQAMRDYVTTTGCRMAFLRMQLDDESAGPCGRCDRCTAPWWPTAAGDEAADSVAAATRRAGVQIPSRSLWPTGLKAVGIDLAGRITAAQAAEPGRALGRLSDIGWGPRLRQLVGTASSDLPEGQALPPEVMDAVIAVLRDWEWEARPTGVAWVPSASHGRLVAALAEGIAGLGRMQLLGPVTRDGSAPRPASTSNSAQRVMGLLPDLDGPSPAAGAVTGDGPVLLVDDLVDTGWTMALAARSLRRAGAPAVLPFALALRS